MNKSLPFFFFLLFFVFSACSDSESKTMLENLHGRWRIDLNAVMDKDAKYQRMNKREKEIAVGLLKAALGGLVFDFDVHEQHIIVLHNREQGKDKFTLKSASAGILVLATDSGELKVEFLNKNRIRFSAAEQGDVILYRE